MQVDWFTFAAQVVNFLILVWLLKKFLYKPVLTAMDRRKASIANRFKEAEEKKEQAVAEHKRYLEMQESLKTSATDEFKKARQEAETLRIKLLEEVRQESDGIRKQWHQNVEKEKKAFLEQISLTLASQLDKLSRSALKDLADEPLEKRIIDAFLRNLHNEPEKVQALKDAFTKDGTLVVSSAFDLDDILKIELSKEISQLFGQETTPEYQRNSNLIAGISLETGGKKIHWDIERYLEDFHKEISANLDKIQKQTDSGEA